MTNKDLYYFSKSELTENYDIEKIGIRGKRAIELAKITMPILPGVIINSNISDKLNKIDIKKELTEFFAKFESETGKKYNTEDNPMILKIVASPSLELVEFTNIHGIGLTDKTIQGFIKNVGEEFAYHEYSNVLLKDTLVLLDKVSKKQNDKDQYAKLSKEILNARKLDAYKKNVESAKNILPKEFFSDSYSQLNFLLKNFSEALLSDEIGENDTALVIQPMAYGNYGEDSYTGKFYTRNVITGERIIQGFFSKNEFDLQSKGKEIEIKDLEKKYYDMLIKIADDIETHYKEIRDIKFIIEKGKLWLIEQSSVVKKSSTAELKCLLYLLKKNIIDEKFIIRSVKPNHISEMLHPIIDPTSVQKFKTIEGGISGSPGAGKGRIFFSADTLIEAQRQSVSQGLDSNYVLCLPATYAEDVKAIEVSNGVLSNEGGYSAHASVVARQYGKTSLVCTDIEIDVNKKEFRSGNITVKEGDYITLDVPYYGEPRIILGNANLINPDPASSGLFDLLKIIDKFKSEFKVFGNADTPKDANRVKMFGGEGIGLCRTEHMFFGEERINIFREMIVSSSVEDRIKSLNKLKSFQSKDFYEILKIMDPHPVTIRLLDAPLHEFLPHSVEEMNTFIAYMKNLDPKIKKEDIAFKCDSISEVNPMLGHRGCRIAVTYPEIYEMQLNAIFEACYKLQKDGIEPKIDIMIPLIMNEEELKFIKNGKKIEGKSIKGIMQIEEEVRSKLKAKKPVHYTVGVMIELPAAALLAGTIAKYAEFFSFGTNDLTQTTHGISRDDFNVFLPDYSQYDLIEANPFKILTDAVKELIQISVTRGRLTRPDLKIGLCGEQGGDPKNIEFLKANGINYVSCSSFSIPIIKLGLAQLIVG